jgi:Fe-Mn family superoxide dismutase
MSLPSSQFSAPTEAARQTYPFTLEELPYAYDALEPHIDQKTLQLHHRAHHAAYVKKLNETLAKHNELHALTLSQLLADLNAIPAAIRSAVRNNGGGHLNHDFFWSALAPAPASSESRPGGKLGDALARQFGSFATFREKFSDAASKHFASGWIALALDHATRNLEIIALKDHEVLPPGAKTGLLILDVWEHAYYLKYQNRRPEFIDAFWHVANWPRAAERFTRAGAR